MEKEKKNAEKKISKGFPLTGFLIKGEIFFTRATKRKESQKAQQMLPRLNSPLDKILLATFMVSM